MAPLLTIVGLGPGDPALLTLEARDALAASPEVWLRTSKHPTVPGLPAGPRYESFDALYDSLASFDAVYAAIVERVLELASRPEGATYSVPGHPLFGEATVRKLLERAPALGLETRVIAGVSFADAALASLLLDPLADGLLLLDALALGAPRRLLAPQCPTLIAQVYDRRAASHAKLALLEAYPPEHTLRVVRSAGGADASVTEVALAELDRDERFDHLVTIYVPPLALTADVRTFEGVRAVIAQLRAPEGGCPWDLEQTHETLKRYLLEEAYEALDALDEGDPHRLAEELGDLLMQIVLHAQVAEDAGEFVIEDIFAAIATKLIRRHPHVFGDATVSGSDEVLRNWEGLKQQERGDAPVLDAVPIAMPALAQAQAVLTRTAKAGLAPAPADGGTQDLTRERLGETLMNLVASAAASGIDAEEALRVAVRRFRDEVGARERASREVSP